MKSEHANSPESNTPKRFLSANELLQQSFQLADMVWEDGYRPDVVLGIWRGGAPVAVALHEYFCWKGHAAQHFPVVCRSYSGMERGRGVEIFGLQAVLGEISSASSILVVDDVLDTGYTLHHLNQSLELAGFSRVRIATPWFKPQKVECPIRPHYWLEETEQWLVFPHELMDLTAEEVSLAKPGLAKKKGPRRARIRG